MQVARVNTPERSVSGTALPRLIVSWSPRFKCRRAARHEDDLTCAYGPLSPRPPTVGCVRLSNEPREFAREKGRCNVLNPTEPLASGALLRQRRLQRRTLAFVHDWIVTDVCTGAAYDTEHHGQHRYDLRSPIDSPAHHRIPTERLLRRMADELLENEAVRGLLVRMDEAAAGDCLQRVLDRRDFVGLETAYTLHEIASKASAKTVRNIKDSVKGAPELKDLVFYLILADLCADDEYTDPRVEALPRRDPQAAGF